MSIIPNHIACHSINDVTDLAIYLVDTGTKFHLPNPNALCDNVISQFQLARLIPTAYLLHLST